MTELWKLKKTTTENIKATHGIFHFVTLFHSMGQPWHSIQQGDSWKLLPHVPLHLYNPILLLSCTSPAVVKGQHWYSPWPEGKVMKKGSVPVMPSDWLGYWEQMPCPLLVLLCNELLYYEMINSNINLSSLISAQNVWKLSVILSVLITVNHNSSSRPAFWRFMKGSQVYPCTGKHSSYLSQWPLITPVCRICSAQK